MQKIDKRQGLMLCAAGLLVFVMLTVFVRLWTSKVLVKRAHMDNVITQTILYGNVDLQKIDTKAPQDKISWEKIYPFADIDGRKKVTSLPTKKIENKAVSVEKKIDEWTGKHLLGYYKLAEVGRWYEAEIGWNLISPTQEIVPLGDGFWSFAHPRVNVQEKSASIAALSQATQEMGAKFIYIQAPFKVDKYGDLAVNGRVDFTNQNCDDLLTQLDAYGITTVDLREDLHHWAQTENSNFHDFFYHTDHHWKPETALKAAKVVGNKLKDYGIPFDDSHYDIQEFDIDVLPEYFLGSQGKRATLAKTKADDFSILHPKFITNIHLNIPEKNIEETGNFELVYDKHCVERRDYYNLNPYAMYGYGDAQVMDIENLLLPPTDKRVLIIKDSFCDTMAPFLALGIRNLMTIDVRHFTGSVKAYIAEHKPDIVIVMYTEVETKPINWSTHTDQYDFR